MVAQAKLAAENPASSSGGGEDAAGDCQQPQIAAIGFLAFASAIAIRTVRKRNS